MDSKLCHTLIHNIRPRIPSRHLKYNTQFPVTGKKSPSARRATVGNLVRSDADIFSTQSRTLQQIFTHAPLFHLSYGFNDLTYKRLNLS